MHLTPGHATPAAPPRHPVAQKGHDGRLETDRMENAGANPVNLFLLQDFSVTGSLQQDFGGAVRHSAPSSPVVSCYSASLEKQVTETICL